jgi:small GTP-binding protein
LTGSICKSHMRKFFTSTGISENIEALEEDPTIYDPDQEQEVVNNENRENNLHWDYVDSTNSARPKINEETVYILVIGDAGVGKTSIIDRYVCGKFDSASASDVAKQKNVNFNNKYLTLKIAECNDLEKISEYTNAHGVLVIYDVTFSQSFASVPKWLKSIRQYCKHNVAVVVVGNKIDQDQRAVPLKSAEEFAMQGGFRYFETSAKNQTNIDNTFAALLHGVNERFTI